MEITYDTFRNIPKFGTKEYDFVVDLLERVTYRGAPYDEHDVYAFCDLKKSSNSFSITQDVASNCIFHNVIKIISFQFLLKQKLLIWVRMKNPERMSFASFAECILVI